MKNKKIPYVNLKLQYKKNRNNILGIIDKVLSSGNYVGGEEIKKFEKKISKICNKKYAIGLNSGTDALTLGLFALGVRKGDEVITCPNSFIASTAAIVHLGAKPVFVDVNDDQNINPLLIEEKITKKTKAIMPIHLTGRVCQMNKINFISKKYNIPIIEDAAQSISSKFNNKPAGSFGKISCFSAHPLKNLNAYGDAGYLLTDDSNMYKLIKDISNHGMSDRDKIKNFGYVSRMDNIQASILNFKLKILKKVIYRRRENENIYFKNLNLENIFIPPETKEEFNTYHTFVVQVSNRDKLKKYLEKKGILTSIHYPIPIHLQPAAKKLGYRRGDFPMTEMQAKKILSLPIHENLKQNEILYICKMINNFFSS